MNREGLRIIPGTSLQRPRPTRWGRSRCPSYHPPTPYTLSPLLKGGEGRTEGGAYTHVPCPFGALLVTLSISHYIGVAASALWALAAAVRARPPAGRARPSPLHIKKALASKWHNSTLLHSESRGSPSLRRLYRAAEPAWIDTRLALSMHPYDKSQPLPPSSQKEKGREGMSGMS